MLEQPSAQEQFALVALPPPHVVHALQKIVENLQTKTGIAEHWGWKKPDDFHITLDRMPNLPVTSVPKLEHVLNGLRQVRPFEACMNRLSLFRPKGRGDLPQVIWAGFEDEGEAGFRAAHAKLMEGARAHDMPQIIQACEPHLTIARPDPRFKREVDALLLEAQIDWKNMPRWRVDSVSLVQRVTYSWQYIQNLSGYYHEVARFSLTAGKIVERDEVMINGDLNTLFRDRVSPATVGLTSLTIN